MDVFKYLLYNRQFQGHYDGYGEDSERTPWWWQLWCARTCWRLAKLSLINIILVTWKLMCASYVAFHTELKHVIRIALSLSFCVTEFLKCNFSEFHYFLCYQYIINTAEKLYYILNIEWAWKLNHSKDSRHESPITKSQTVGTWN